MRRSNNYLQIKFQSANQTSIRRSKNCLIWRSKNYLQIEESRDQKSIQSEGWRTICRSKNCLQIIQRAICRLKNYLEIEELSANRRIWGSKKFSILRLKNYVQILFGTESKIVPKSRFFKVLPQVWKKGFALHIEFWPPDNFSICR